MKIRKEQIVKIIGFVAFMVIICVVLNGVTNLYRNNEFAVEDKITVAGIKEELPLDVVYIGGSAAYSYWEPLKAFRDTGLVSYALAVNSIQAECILPFVKYTEKYQNPELYVIGIRAFQYYKSEGDEYFLRNTSDTLDNGYIRSKLIHDYCKNRILDENELNLQLDIIKYHTNPYALCYKDNWDLIDNSMKCDFKGGQPKMSHSSLVEPVGFQTSERGELMEQDVAILNELLNYLRKHGKKALFIVCPYNITKEEYAIYNSLSDIIKDNGFDYLNANDYYDEIGIDFASDYSDGSHTNPLGSEKYTKWLEEYLMNNYSLSDHRGEALYNEWSCLADEYVSVGIERREKINEIIETGLSIEELEELEGD